MEKGSMCESWRGDGLSNERVRKACFTLSNGVQSLSARIRSSLGGSWVVVEIRRGYASVCGAIEPCGKWQRFDV
jgi:hypothetical protein